ncbi:DUF3038 domain-containing protein [Oscillatoria sp. CS-180]|uniref:DUF3038 domain-containing protein n=1 Tax=Oscillatoria sp. CS-180 TaxID=3021720 RepID=UPI00232E60CE|nr:DUF3038 domain-containing protein [Oscillatoria sp. CS-180]MDB9524469.1 DUF3038 domain-containing protein [Oscillatoria sp. CS-180]
MQVDSPPAPSPPSILDTLPSPNLPTTDCPRRVRIDLDLLMLAIEALDVGGSEAILKVTEQLGLKTVIANRVRLWLIRSTNPMRRQSQRDPLSLEEAKALAIAICFLAKRLTVLIRQLLLGHQQLSDKQLSLEHHFRLSEYLQRFRSLFRARMNPQRAGVIAYDTDEKLDALAITLLTRLLFCTGTQGPQRLWSSLFDGEVV